MQQLPPLCSPSAGQQRNEGPPPRQSTTTTTSSSSSSSSSSNSSDDDSPPAERRPTGILPDCRRRRRRRRRRHNSLYHEPPGTRTRKTTTTTSTTTTTTPSRIAPVLSSPPNRNHAGPGQNGTDHAAGQGPKPARGPLESPTTAGQTASPGRTLIGRTWHAWSSASYCSSSSSSSSSPSSSPSSSSYSSSSSSSSSPAFFALGRRPCPPRYWDPRRRRCPPVMHRRHDPDSGTDSPRSGTDSPLSDSDASAFPPRRISRSRTFHNINPPPFPLASHHHQHQPRHFSVGDIFGPSSFDPHNLPPPPPPPPHHHHHHPPPPPPCAESSLPHPPQTTHYWTSHRTRRLEYAAIDSATRGLRGWLRRHLVPDCFGPQLVAFDDDSGSVRRYRLELPDDDEDEDEDDDDDSLDDGELSSERSAKKRRPGWQFWHHLRKTTSL
ncbi:hypothetical protein XA68_15664 [Ophiocordyceps unilateralis]|uniref:Uncharacterized protein n=1 Tax=Ophiocordyceps unilateralis TaxID=268505 RepID=A0A2A9P6P2_OPHUN|nr:hypothetical protein XA68_15664 [Ophiocordyceps unilateralis]